MKFKKLRSVALSAALAGTLFTLVPQNAYAAAENITIKSDTCPTNYVIYESDGTICKRYQITENWATGLGTVYREGGIDSAGNIYYIDSNKKLKKIVNTGGTPSDVLTFASNPIVEGLAVASSGTVLPFYQNKTIDKVSGSSLVDFGTWTESYYYSTVVNAAGTIAYGYSQDSIYKMTDGGSETLVVDLGTAEGVQDIVRMVIDESDDLYVVTDLGIYMINTDDSTVVDYFLLSNNTDTSDVIELMWNDIVNVGEDNRLYTLGILTSQPFARMHTSAEASKKYTHSGAIKEPGLVAADSSSNMYLYMRQKDPNDFYITLAKNIQRTSLTGYNKVIYDSPEPSLLGIFTDDSGDLFVPAANNSLTKIDFTEQDLGSPVNYTWQMNGGKTSAAMTIQEFDGKMYQAIRGNSDPYHIYIRSTDDGKFDGTDEWEAWDKDGVAGKTSDQPSLAVFNNRLYIAVRGNSGNVFTKSMGTDGNWDSTWNDNGGATGTSIGMTTVNFGDGDRLYQVIRGNSTNNIYQRYTKDGNFDGGEGENWIQISGQTPNAIAITTVESALFMSVRGNSGEIFNRFTADGTWDGSSATENFTQNGGKTSLAPTITSYQGIVYQMVKGNSTESIFTRATRDGVNWTGWVEKGGKTQTRPAMGAALGKLQQAVRGNSGEIFTREFAELKTHDSDNYTEFSFDYFDFWGEYDQSTTLGACPDDSTLEVVAWSSFRSVTVGSECTGMGSGDVTLVKSYTLTSKDSQTFNVQVFQFDTNGKYILWASSAKGTGVLVSQSFLDNLTQMAQAESEIRVIIESLVYTP